MARPKKFVEAAKKFVEAEPLQPVSIPRAIRMRVVKDVLGMKAGYEFEGNMNDYKLQIKHKSIEVI
jgi:hypothetical protein